MDRSEPKVRDLTERDAAGAAAVLRELEPHIVVTDALVLHWLRARPERAQMRVWVAEQEKAVVGLGFAALKWTRAEPGIGELGVGVLPPHAGGARARGCTSWPSDIRGSRRAQGRSWVGDDEAGRRFAERCGVADASSPATTRSTRP